MHVRFSWLLAVAAAGLVVACSPSNPVRPSMSFTTPTAATPIAGASYNFSDQPVVLRFVNAMRTGTSAVAYTVEVSTSASFSTIAFTASNITEGDSFTSVTLPALAGNTTYYWRTRAVVDGVEGQPSAPVSFFVRPAITLQAPVVVSPAEGAPVFLARPLFTVDNVDRSGSPGALTYEFQIADTAAFGSLIASGAVPETTARTSWSPDVDLSAGTFFWRARAVDRGNAVNGPFSSASSFERRGFGSAGDQLDLSAATIVLGPADIGTWPATARVTSTVARPGEICIDHDRLGSWPGTAFFDEPGTLVQGNQWMFAFINGRWYGGGGRWFRPGQPCKGTNSDDGFGGTFYMDAAEPLRSYVPKPGDFIGLMSTTPARFYPAMRTVDERSNVVVVPWGS